MDVSIVIVNYNSIDFLKECLESLYSYPQGVSFEVIVVDNGSNDGQLAQITKQFPNVYCIENKANKGFAAANNQGIKRAVGEFILLLNPDTNVQAYSLREIVSFFHRSPRVGIAGCKMFYKDGRLQYSAHSFPSPLVLFSEAVFLDVLFPRSRVFGKSNLTCFSYDKERPVDWVVGAFFMIRREVITRVGLLDEQFFMYSEEVDYCLRAVGSGYEVWFVPHATIVHYWGGVTAMSKRSLWWGHLSQLILFRKHFNGPTLWLLVFLKFLGIVNRIVAYCLLGCLMFNRRLLLKSYYQSYAICRLILGSWSFSPLIDQPE